MTNSSVTTSGQQDVTTISALTTLDKMDGSAYVDKTLAGQAITYDTTNHRISFTFTAPVWATLGAGTRQMKGIIIYKDSTGTNVDATNIPLFWIDDGFPITATGVDFTYAPNTGGIFYW